jgi:hypothetical protein
MDNHVSRPPAQHRPGWLKRTCRAAALGVFLAFSPLVSTSCAIPSVYMAEYQKAAKTDANAQTLGLRKGVSGYEETLKLLRKRGVTNIATARGLDAAASAKADAGGKDVIIDAVTGDFMGEVLIFRNRVFSGALAIGADAGVATRMYLHIVHTEGLNAVAIVSNDISRQGFPSIAVLLDRPSPKRYFISHGNFPGAETGFNDPLMVGDDLGGNGVTFVWRDHRGFPAEDGVILKCDGKELKVTKVGMQKLIGCDCIYGWYNKVK